MEHRTGRKFGESGPDCAGTTRYQTVGFWVSVSVEIYGCDDERRHALSR